ncbi:Protein of unknown function [Gryllus bimaculatus]|nr:Protein of unknown function [Gryllus bimaculatus]
MNACRDLASKLQVLFANMRITCTRDRRLDSGAGGSGDDDDPARNPRRKPGSREVCESCSSPFKISPGGDDDGGRLRSSRRPLTSAAWRGHPTVELDATRPMMAGEEQPQEGPD